MEELQNAPIFDWIEALQDYANEHLPQREEANAGPTRSSSPQETADPSTTLLRSVLDPKDEEHLILKHSSVHKISVSLQDLLDGFAAAQLSEHPPTRPEKHKLKKIWKSERKRQSSLQRSNEPLANN